MELEEMLRRSFCASESPETFDLLIEKFFVKYMNKVQEAKDDESTQDFINKMRKYLDIVEKQRNSKNV